MQQKKRRETSSDKQAVRRTTCGWLLIVASSLACAGAGAQATGAQSVMERDGFDTRRRQGLGAFLSGEDLDHVRTTQLATTLGSLRGMHVDGGTMPMLRGMKGPMKMLLPTFDVVRQRAAA